jgi:hypothetical protein
MTGMTTGMITSNYNIIKYLIENEMKNESTDKLMEWTILKKTLKKRQLIIRVILSLKLLVGLRVLMQ